MKKRIRLIIMIIVSVLTICLIIWRFWPQSFTKVTSVDKNSIVRVSVHAMFNEFENGQTNIDTYRIDDMDQQMNTLEEIMEILATSSYRQDFRNLLLWDLDYVDADKNYDGRTVTVSFYMNNQMDKYVQIQFLSSSIIVVSSGSETGFRVYHPTNHQTIDQLSEYIQTHGVKE